MLPDYEYLLWVRQRGVKIRKNVDDMEIKKHIYHLERDILKKLHPTVKPLIVNENIIKIATDEGDLVLDAFMGSGTTGVACKHTNRKFIGIEKNEEFFKTAIKRFKEE